MLLDPEVMDGHVLHAEEEPAAAILHHNLGQNTLKYVLPPILLTLAVLVYGNIRLEAIFAPLEISV